MGFFPRLYVTNTQSQSRQVGQARRQWRSKAVNPRFPREEGQTLAHYHRPGIWSTHRFRNPPWELKDQGRLLLQGKITKCALETQPLFQREEKTIPKDKIAELVSFGDLSQIPLDHLSSFVDDVVDGILSYNDNFATWPSVVSSDVQAHVHKLKSEVYEISGSVKGKLALITDNKQILF